MALIRSLVECVGGCESTFIADVEASVVVGLIGDELDPHRWTFADHTLEGDLTPPTRVEQNHRPSVQTAPQNQPAGRSTAVRCVSLPGFPGHPGVVTCLWGPEPASPSAGAASAPWGPPGTRSRTGPGWRWGRDEGTGTEPVLRWRSSPFPHTELSRRGGGY